MRNLRSLESAIGAGDRDYGRGAAKMFCHHESELAIDEEYHIDAVPIQTFAPEDEIDRTSHLLRKEETAEKDVQDVKQRTVAGDHHQQIFSLYEEFHPRLLRYIHRMYLKRDLAEEVIQETFLRLTNELMRGEDIQNMQGWIIRVAHNLAVDAIKKKEKDAARMTNVTSAELEAFVNPSDGPDEIYHRKEQTRRIETGLLTLNPQQRQCFSLRAHGFRYKDIGQALGISEQRAAIVVKQVAVRLAAMCAIGGVKVE